MMAMMVTTKCEAMTTMTTIMVDDVHGDMDDDGDDEEDGDK